MWKYTVEVNGMVCGMCEAHVNDAVRKACPVKKVSSSRSKNQTVILSETELDTEAVMNAIRSTGYEVGTIQKEPYKKERIVWLSSLAAGPEKRREYEHGNAVVWIWISGLAVLHRYSWRVP